MKQKSRRSFFKKASISLASFSLSSLLPPVLATGLNQRVFKIEPEVYFTTGFKTAEVSSNSALLWTRICSQPKPNPIIHKREEKVFRHPIEFDENMPVEQMDGAVKGIGGLVRATLLNAGKNIKSEWYPALEENDFTVEIPFDELKPETAYQIIWEAKLINSENIFETRGFFQTAPDSNSRKPIQLVTSTCQYFWSYDNDTRGFDSYDSMSRLNPDFFVHTGDYIYYDKPGPLAKTIAKARHKWHAMDSWSSLKDFFKNTPIYMEKDDHDLLKDDVYPTSDAYGELTFNDGLKIWNENAPIRNKPYRTFRWGKDLQMWLVEGREYRSANKLEDSPQKTIWGSAQKEWFQETVKASDATFKILFSPTPVVGPDRDAKIDNHANKSFQNEGDWLRDYLSAQKDMYVVNGDRHWQYVSVDGKTGLMEFGSGPVSDAHAQGWDQEDLRTEHRFLRVNGGFMGINVFREGDKPVIIFTHYDTNGNSVHEERFPES
ncbi:alkaline phosphatase D family protein [Algoriphagus antarcticus]|uniref:Alkaline phosphatase D n=1 Tax=Algoriphagus antarcticus TaxID=238540 RepID=A0A3E0DXI4_9BACT|nr:alkaline phosphatase D family protein [Algoriphagus antarcticus]REG88703.1 alkaline phosphatase D [Algoriphagus antarcticus]